MLKSPEFFKVRKEGCFFKSNNLLFFYLKTESNFSRLGLSVSKKFAKKAVVRNRVKRLIREAFRVSRLNLPSSVDFIVVPRKHFTPKLHLKAIMGDFQNFIDILGSSEL